MWYRYWLDCGFWGGFLGCLCCWVVDWYWCGFCGFFVWWCWYCWLDWFVLCLRGWILIFFWFCFVRILCGLLCFWLVVWWLGRSFVCNCGWIWWWCCGLVLDVVFDFCLWVLLLCDRLECWLLLVRDRLRDLVRSFCCFCLFCFWIGLFDIFSWCGLWCWIVMLVWYVGWSGFGWRGLRYWDLYLRLERLSLFCVCCGVVFWDFVRWWLCVGLWCNRLFWFFCFDIL